jgi:hypothetical protein
VHTCLHGSKKLARILQEELYQVSKSAAFKVSDSTTIDQALKEFFRFDKYWESWGKHKALGVGPSLESPVFSDHWGIVYQSSDFLAGSLSNSNRFTTAPDCGNKIFWNPKGRLGNMMFGYASLVGIAKRKGKIPVIIADCDHHDRLFAFKQKIDNKLCEFVSAFDIPAEPSPSTCDQSKKTTYHEEAFARFEPKAVASDFLSYEGYFQSWKYFDGSEKDVRQMFSVPKTLRQDALDYLDTPGYRDRPTVCMQVRRSDKLQKQSLYTLQTKNYFEAAWAKVSEVLRFDRGTPSLFVTGSSPEDMTWATENFKKITEDINVHSGSYLEDFAFLQNACDALILSGSTFGWWAGYTSPRAKVVIAPKVIMNPVDKESRRFSVADHYPPSFILL